MAEKNVIIRGLIAGVLHDLLPKGSIYNTYVDTDTTLAEKLAEVIESLNDKVKVSDIVNDLVSGGTDVPLSAEMGKRLRELLDNGGGGVETDPTVPSWAKNPTKPTYTAEEIRMLSDASSPFLVDMIQEIINALNIKYSESNPPPYPVESVNGMTGEVTLPDYATKDFVTSKIAEAELGGGGGDIDLSGYALKSDIPTKVSQLANDKNYLTEHQDISHLLPRTELPTAIDTALAQAKASGEFNGEDGEDGHTPVRGTDYWTDADKAEIKSYVDDAILGGAW